MIGQESMSRLEQIRIKLECLEIGYQLHMMGYHQRGESYMGRELFYAPNGTFICKTKGHDPMGWEYAHKENGSWVGAGAPTMGSEEIYTLCSIPRITYQVETEPLSAMIRETRKQLLELGAQFPPPAFTKGKQYYGHELETAPDLTVVADSDQEIAIRYGGEWHGDGNPGYDHTEKFTIVETPDNWKAEG